MDRYPGRTDWATVDLLAQSEELSRQRLYAWWLHLQDAYFGPPQGEQDRPGDAQLRARIWAQLVADLKAQLGAQDPAADSAQDADHGLVDGLHPVAEHCEHLVVNAEVCADCGELVGTIDPWAWDEDQDEDQGDDDDDVCDHQDYVLDTDTVDGIVCGACGHYMGRLIVDVPGLS